MSYSRKFKTYLSIIAAMLILVLACPPALLAENLPYMEKDSAKAPLIPLEGYEKLQALEKEAVQESQNEVIKNEPTKKLPAEPIIVNNDYEQKLKQQAVQETQNDIIGNEPTKELPAEPVIVNDDKTEIPYEIKMNDDFDAEQQRELEAKRQKEEARKQAELDKAKQKETEILIATLKEKFEYMVKTVSLIKEEYGAFLRCVKPSENGTEIWVLDENGSIIFSTTDPTLVYYTKLIYALIDDNYKRPERPDDVPLLDLPDYRDLLSYLEKYKVEISEGETPVEKLMTMLDEISSRLIPKAELFLKNAKESMGILFKMREAKAKDGAEKHIDPVIISPEDYEALKALKECKEIEILPEGYKDMDLKNYEKISFAYLINANGMLVGMKISGPELTIYLDCRDADHDSIAEVIKSLAAANIDSDKKQDNTKPFDALPPSPSKDYDHDHDTNGIDRDSRTYTLSPVNPGRTNENPNGSEPEPNEIGRDQLPIALNFNPKDDNLSKTDTADNWSSDRSKDSEETTVDTGAIKKNVSKLLKAQESAVKKFYKDAGPYYSKLASDLLKAHWLWENQGIDPHLYYAGANGVIGQREMRRMVEESVAYLYENIPSGEGAQSERDMVISTEKTLREQYVDPALSSYKKELQKASSAFYKSMEGMIKPLINPFISNSKGTTEIIISLPKGTLK